MSITLFTDSPAPKTGILLDAYIWRNHMFYLRAFLSRVAVAFLVCALVPSFVLAQAVEMPTREIWKAGDMSVTVIQDLPGEMSISLFSGPASEEERSKYFTDGKAEAGINAFLLRAGGKIALFDTGAGTLFKSPGKLPEALAALGVKLEDVDLIMLTHMHMDHAGGLMRGKERVFPKAKLLISKPEIDAWTALSKADPPSANAVVAASAALTKDVVAAYEADIQPFAFGDTLLPGVMALDASGHTPGHTVFQLTADDKTLLVIGDLIHSMPLQFALPDECAEYDMDTPKAIEARKRIFALAEKSGSQIAGVHFPFANTVGTIKKDGEKWKFERTQ